LPIKAEGAVYNAMGAGKIAPIAADDIAAVAVHALTDPSLTPEVFEVTGGELLTIPRQVGILADAVTRPIRCVDVSTESAIQALLTLVHRLPWLRLPDSPSRQFATVRWRWSKTQCRK
jgi:uncharacterized protein YbjT (DUF2867 family)